MAGIFEDLTPLARAQAETTQRRWHRGRQVLPVLMAATAIGTGIFAAETSKPVEKIVGGTVVEAGLIGYRRHLRSEHEAAQNGLFVYQNMGWLLVALNETKTPEELLKIFAEGLSPDEVLPLSPELRQSGLFPEPPRSPEA